MKARWITLRSGMALAGLLTLVSLVWACANAPVGNLADRAAGPYGPYEPDRFAAVWSEVVVDPAAMSGADLGPFQFVSLHALQTARQGGSLPDRVGGISSLLAAPLGGPADPAAFVTDQGQAGVIGLPGQTGAAAMVAIGPVQEMDGSALAGQARQDGEGLTFVLIDGQTHIAASYERDHRIVLFRATPGWAGLWQPTLPGLLPGGAQILQANGGIEALVAVENGTRLLAISEYGPAWAAGGSLFWLLDAASVQSAPLAGVLEVADGYGVTEARLSGDTLWLLLRRWREGEGTRVRIASCPVSGFLSGRPECSIRASLAPPFPVDNFEAMIITPAPIGDGQLFRLMSDDNFDAAQRTLLLTLRLPDGG